MHADDQHASESPNNAAPTGDARSSSSGSYTLGSVRHMVLRNVIYHEGRLRHFDLLNRLAVFVTLVLGTAAALDVGKKLWGEGSQVGLWVGAAVAVIGALQLVLDFTGFARVHQILHREFSRLLAEMMRTDNATDQQINAWVAKIIEIGLDAPPTLRALDAIAYNEAWDTLSIDDTERLVIPIYRRITCHYLRHTGYPFRTRAERDKARSNWFVRLFH